MNINITPFPFAPAILTHEDIIAELSKKFSFWKVYEDRVSRTVSIKVPGPLRADEIRAFVSPNFVFHFETYGPFGRKIIEWGILQNHVWIVTR